MVKKRGRQGDSEKGELRHYWRLLRQPDNATARETKDCGRCQNDHWRPSWWCDTIGGVATSNKRTEEQGTKEQGTKKQGNKGNWKTKGTKRRSTVGYHDKRILVRWRVIRPIFKENQTLTS